MQEAVQQYDPSIVANFSYEVVRYYNAFYQQCSILREEDPIVRTLRLRLCELSGSCIKSSMSILGIEMPERM